MAQASLKFTGSRMANPKRAPSPAQLAARAKFAEMARSGGFAKRRKAAPKRKANPGAKFSIGDTVKFAPDVNKRAGGIGKDSRGVVVSVDSKVPYVGVDFQGTWNVNEETGSTVRMVPIKNLVSVGRKTNPDKSKPRAYVRRVSQATGEPPSKRLTARRKAALEGPEGYFPNPKVKYTNTAKDLSLDERVGYSVHSATMPGHLGFAWFSKKADAVEAAQEASNRTGKQLAVSRMQIHFGPLNTNPDKSKPRAYVRRVSQATGEPPSKRLIARRKAALEGPEGYFPNPKSKRTYTVYWELPHSANSTILGVFFSLEKAKQYARAHAKLYPSHYVRVESRG